MTDLVDRLNAALKGLYRIERTLGEGGMATVYLADDLKHGRKVALKVLKPELAAVVGAERFLAEIKTTANLQHPHILPLFDSGEADSFLFYVMPYVEGESLRERLNREHQLPLDEAVQIAKDIGDALQAAHEQGVIHRDVKPANILLSNGRPLVSDFGIALALSAGGGSRLTETGLSLGTPHYMSPEQATGDVSIGVATDIYALGCVLYEMLVGEPPYTGSTPQAILGKIIAGELTPASSQRPTVPPNVDAAIQKALENVPADRFQTARDLVSALGNAQFRHGTYSAHRTHGPAVWNPLTRGFAVATAVLAATLLWSLGRAADDSDVRWQRVQLHDSATFGGGVGSVRFRTAIAPEGDAIVVVDGESQGLKLKTASNVEPLLILGSEGENPRAPVFSPDGEWIAYFSLTDRTLRKIPRTGGVPTVLADSIATSFWQAAWLDDGTLLFTSFGWHLSRVSENGGSVERIVDRSTTSHPYVTFVSGLPGGRGALISVCGTDCLNAEVHVLDLDTRETSPVMAGAMGAWYARTGHVIAARRSGEVVAAPFDLRRLEITGSSAVVLDGVQTRPQFADLTLAAAGTLLYRPGSPPSLQYSWSPVWVNREGRFDAVVEGWEGDMEDPQLSGDDQLLAVKISADRVADIYVRHLTDGTMTRLTNDDRIESRPTWTPDGRSVAFAANTPELAPGRHLRVRRADASLPAEILIERDDPVIAIDWSDEGEDMVYVVGLDQLGMADIWSGRVAGTEAHAPLLEEDYNELAPALSPDGSWLAYVSLESGVQEIFVRPYPNVSDASYQVSIAGGRQPVWSPDGGELFYQSLGESWMMSASVEVGAGFQVVERRRLFAWDPHVYRGASASPQYDVASDAQRFLMLRNVLIEEVPNEGIVPVLVLAESWFSELCERLGDC